MSRIARRNIVPVNQITPLTYRDGVTYIQMLTELSEYVKSILHPSLQHTVDQLVADVETQMDQHHDQYVDGVHEFQRIHDAFMSDVNAKLIALNDGASADLIRDSSSLLSQVLRDLFVDQESLDETVSHHVSDETTKTHYSVKNLIENSSFLDDLDNRFDQLADEQNTTLQESQQAIEHAQQRVDRVVDDLLSDVSGAVRDQLGSQLADMVLNDEQTIKAMSNMLSRQDVVRTDYSQLGARILVGTLNNHGADGKQGTVSGGPYEPYWQFSKNVSHQDWGFDRVVTTDTGIEIYTKPPMYNHRITGGAIIAKVDESMAKDHWFVGGSGGGTRTVLQLSRNKTISDRVQYVGGRWQTSFNEVRPSWSGNQLILNHENMYGQGGGVVQFWPRETTRPYFAHILAQNNTRTVIGFWDHNGNRVERPTPALGVHFFKSDSGNSPINPKEVFVRNGNIWLLLIQMYVPQDWSG